MTLGPDERVLTPEEVALEDAENDPRPKPVKPARPSRDYLNDQYPDPRSADNSDGHLEADDYWRRHPEEDT